MSYLIGLDQAWFQLVNSTLTHPWLDSFFTYITNLHHHQNFVYFVFPTLLTLYVWVLRKKALKTLVALILVGGFCDLLSYRILKPTVGRLRPHYTLGKSAVVRVPYKPKSHSFPSNHALTGFALARVITWAHPVAHLWAWVAAGIIAYSRVYVGVHYPSDVLGGAVLGYAIATALIFLIFSRVQFLSPFPIFRPSKKHR